jgi:hypothetical protein
MITLATAFILYTTPAFTVPSGESVPYRQPPKLPPRGYAVKPEELERPKNPDPDWIEGQNWNY